MSYNEKKTSAKNEPKKDPDKNCLRFLFSEDIGIYVVEFAWYAGGFMYMKIWSNDACWRIFFVNRAIEIHVKAALVYFKHRIFLIFTFFLVLKSKNFTKFQRKSEVKQFRFWMLRKLFRMPGKLM